MKLLTLRDIHQLKVAKYMFAISKGILPSPLMNIITANSDIHTHNTRNKENPHVNTRRTNIASKLVRHNGPFIWNNIQHTIKESKKHQIFYI